MPPACLPARLAMISSNLGQLTGCWDGPDAACSSSVPSYIEMGGCATGSVTTSSSQGPGRPDAAATDAASTRHRPAGACAYGGSISRSRRTSSRGPLPGMHYVPKQACPPPARSRLWPCWPSVPRPSGPQAMRRRGRSDTPPHQCARDAGISVGHCPAHVLLVALQRGRYRIGDCGLMASHLYYASIAFSRFRSPSAIPRTMRGPGQAGRRERARLCWPGGNDLVSCLARAMSGSRRSSGSGSSHHLAARWRLLIRFFPIEAPFHVGERAPVRFEPWTLA